MALVTLGCSFQGPMALMTLDSSLLGFSPKTQQQFGAGLGQHLEVQWNKRRFSVIIFLGNATNCSLPT